MDEIKLLKRQLHDYRWLFDTVDVAILIIDQDGNYLDHNKAYFKLMGYHSKKELQTFHPANVSPETQPDGKNSFKKANEMIEIAISEGKHSFDWMHKKSDGVEFMSHVILDTIEFDGKQCVRGVIQDISETKRLERIVQERTKELEKLAVTDHLTGLYNRTQLDEILRHEFNRSTRFNHSFAIVLLDIDNFKQINDTYGHDAGDRVLIQFAEILQNHCRNTDTVCRWGGEEFLIILPESDLDGAYLMAENLRDIIDINNFDKAAHVTASFGVDVFNEGDTINELFKRVDKALYQAKSNGKNQVVTIS